MKVNEIFASIEGEGSRAGYPAVFVRLHGCNLRCSYCDSMYAVTGQDYVEMTVEEIVDSVSLYHIPRVTLTGGEPLIHKDVIMLIDELSTIAEVNIETNGAVDLQKFIEDAERHCYRNKIMFTMDWKSISSGMQDKMIPTNISYLTSSDVLKFVVSSVKDLKQAEHVIKYLEPKCQIFISPVFGQIEPKQIVQYMQAAKMHNCRIQLQLHKFIWSPDTKGV